jgi:hypothetical protein
VRSFREKGPLAAWPTPIETNAPINAGIGSTERPSVIVAPTSRRTAERAGPAAPGPAFTTTPPVGDRTAGFAAVPVVREEALVGGDFAAFDAGFEVSLAVGAGFEPVPVFVVDAVFLVVPARGVATGFAFDVAFAADGFVDFEATGFATGFFD